MADLTLTCPHCGQGINLPATITESDHDAGRVVLQLDRDQSNGLAHLAECRKAKALTAAAVPKAELAGRIGQMLDMRAYVATGGSRACTLCGMNGRDCLEQLGKPGEGIPCCAGCGNGNTHPAPGEAKGVCSEWAAAHHQADQ